MTPEPDRASQPVSVVIPSYRRLERLPGLIDAYLRQGADQVVVVLDGPHPGWQQHVEAWRDDARVSVTELERNVGAARARVEGVHCARGDIVVEVDDDVEPSDGFLKVHREFHRNGGDRVLLGYMPVALPARRGRDDAPTYLYARAYEQQAVAWRNADSASVLGSLWGGTVSLPRDLYLRAERSMPSERLDYHEDLDLGLRLQRLGAEGYFDAQALASHHHVRDLKGLMRECAVQGKSLAALEERWGTLPAQLTPLVDIPASNRRSLAAMQRSIARRDRGGAAQQLLVALYRCAGTLRLFALQDRLTGLLHRGLVLRAYRLEKATRGAAER